MNPGNYLYLVEEVYGQEYLKTYQDFGYEELLEVQPMLRSVLIPISGSPRWASVHAKDLLVKRKGNFSVAELLVAYKSFNNSNRIQVSSVIQYYWVDDQVVSRTTGALRETRDESPTFF